MCGRQMWNNVARRAYTRDNVRPQACRTRRGGDEVEFSSHTYADTVVAVPVGRLDHGNATQLQELLAPIVAAAAAKKSPIVLDLANVEYISSMGLRVLMVAAKPMCAAGARIAVANLQPVVEEIFDIARFRYVVPVFTSLRDALWELSPRAAEAFDHRKS